jgi:hypothetical protein
LWGKDNDDSHFRDEETEAQPDEVTCPRSSGQEVAEAGFKPGLSGSTCHPGPALAPVHQVAAA